MTVSQPQSPPKKHRTIFWVLLTAATAAILLFICSGLIFAASQMDWLPGSVVTEADFNTNQERLNFINQTLPVSLPTTSVINQFHYESFTDYNINLEATIPLPDVIPFIQSLPPLDQPIPNTFEGDIGPNWIKIEIDPTTGTVHIEYFTV